MIMSSKKSSTRGKRNILKVVSLVFIVLFISIITGGFIQASTQKQFTEPGGDLAELAREIVAQDLLSMGDSIDNYDIYVTNRMVGFVNGHRPMGKHAVWPGPGGCLSDNIQVILKAENSGMLYMVNAETERVMMRSHTEWFSE